MTTRLFYPGSVEDAEIAFEAMGARPLVELSTEDFIRVWCSVVYLNPGLHTDNFHDPEYECEPLVRGVLKEVWRRADAGELLDAELYPADVIRARLMGE